MRILDHIVHALGTTRVTGKASLLAQLIEAIRSTSHYFMDVSLMASVPEDGILGRDENPVEGNRQLHHAQIWPEVTTGRRDLSHQEFPDLCRQLRKLIGPKGPNVAWVTYPLKKTLQASHILRSSWWCP